MTASPPSRRAVLGGLGVTFAARPLLARTSSGPTLLRAAAMRADVALLRRAYAALHPGLHRYNTPREIDARFDALDQSVAVPMTLRAFYLTLSRFLATVRCGHSYANFYNQRRAVAAALFEAPDRLPLDFLWIGDAMVVTADPFATGIAPGSRILAVNGRSASAILAALMPLARADGHNDAKRRRLLSVQGDDRYETFDIFFSMLFGQDRYRLTVEDPAGRRRAASVAGVSLAQRRATAHAGVDARSDTPVWTIERRGDAALLSMPNWGLYDSKWDWRGWLDEAVDRLVAERVPRLVVDLRANEGGSTVATRSPSGWCYARRRSRRSSGSSATAPCPTTCGLRSTRGTAVSTIWGRMRPRSTTGSCGSMRPATASTRSSHAVGAMRATCAF